MKIISTYLLLFDKLRDKIYPVTKSRLMEGDNYHTRAVTG